MLTSKKRRSKTARAKSSRLKLVLKDFLEKTEIARLLVRTPMTATARGTYPPIQRMTASMVSQTSGARSSYIQSISVNDSFTGDITEALRGWPMTSQSQGYHSLLYQRALHADTDTAEEILAEEQTHNY